MTKTEKKKAFFGVLTPHFKEKGFKSYLKGGDPSYVYYDGGIAIRFFFNFPTRSKDIEGGAIILTLYEVEDYILTNGLPSAYLDEVKKREKYHLATVILFEHEFPSDALEVDSKEEVEEYAYNFIDFYESKGVDFIKKYTYLPNIYRELIKLEKIGKPWSDLLSGMGDSFIRGLIIYKLCDSVHYSEKFKQINH